MLAHGALDAACIPVPASAQIWSARRDSNPQGFHPLRSERSAYACSATRGKLEHGPGIEPGIDGFADHEVTVSFPCSNLVG